MDKSKLIYFFPVAIIAVAARLFFYPWDFTMTFPVWIGTLLIMIFGLTTLAIMIHNDRRRLKSELRR